jgi:hypothetical protein
MSVLAFDLDGTLCETADMDYMAAVPKWDAIERVNALHDAGDRIIVDTARGSGTGEDWTDRTAAQLARWGVRYHVLRCGVKFPADRYIDDRGVNVVDWLREGMVLPTRCNVEPV